MPKTNEQEKKDHPYHVTTLGYVKNIPYKEAFANAWHNWSDDNRKYNKETKEWYWFTPPPVDLAIEKSYMKRVEVRDKVTKKRKP